MILSVAVLALVAGFMAGTGASQAALQNAVGVKLHFKKAGGPGSVQVQLVNVDDVPLPEGRPLSKGALHNALYDGGVVPQPIRRMIVQSSSIKFNRKALPYCKVIFAGQRTLPTRANGMTGAEELTYVPGKRNSRAVARVCPQKSIIGKGTFTATVGTPGTPYNPAQAGALEGTLVAYNHSPKPGHTLGTVVRLHVDNPVPSNQYLYVGVSRRGVMTADIPTRAEIPTNLDATIPPGEISMTSVELALKAPAGKLKRSRHGRRARRGVPIFTVKSFKKLDVYGQLIR
jgi:hypothetical protein